MHNLTAFQRNLLYIIAGANYLSGQDVKDDLDQYYNSDINHGRLYPNLDTVVEKDLVEKDKIDKQSNYYEITDFGLQRIKNHRKWRSQFDD